MLSKWAMFPRTINKIKKKSQKFLNYSIMKSDDLPRLKAGVSYYLVRPEGRPPYQQVKLIIIIEFVQLLFFSLC